MQFATSCSQVFIADLSKELGFQVTAPWASSPVGAAGAAGAAGGNSSAAGAAAPKASVPETIAEMKSETRQVIKLGFKKDAYISPKAEKDLQTWRVDLVTEAGAECTLVAAGEEREQKTIALDDMLKDWRIHKGKVTAKLIGWDFESTRCSPLASPVWKMDVAKGAIAMALMSEYKDHEHLLQGLCLLQNPSIVKATRAFKAGELCLVPASQRIERKQSPGSLPVGRFDLGAEDDTILYLGSQFVPPVSANGTENKSTWVAPFWIVNSTEAADANMDLVHVERDIKGIKVFVPLLKNKKALKEGDEVKRAKNDHMKEPTKNKKSASAAVGSAAPEQLPKKRKQ